MDWNMKKPKAEKKKTKKSGSGGKTLEVLVSEAPSMSKQMDALRKKNERLRKVIDLLLEDDPS